MSCADYNPETIRRARNLAREGWPHGAVAAKLGWSLSRLLQTAERHRIDFVRIVAKSRTPDPKRANIHWNADLEQAFHGAKSVYLPPAESRVFRAILKHGEYDWSTEKMAAAARIPRKHVSAHVSQLRGNLESIGLTIARRTYELSRT